MSHMEVSVKSGQLVQCEFVCERVRSCVAPFISGHIPFLSADGVLRLPDGRELRRPMPLRKGLVLIPGTYKVEAYIRPFYRIESAVMVVAASQ